MKACSLRYSSPFILFMPIKINCHLQGIVWETALIFRASKYGVTLTPPATCSEGFHPKRRGSWRNPPIGPCTSSTSHKITIWGPHMKSVFTLFQWLISNAYIIEHSSDANCFATLQRCKGEIHGNKTSQTPNTSTDQPQCACVCRISFRRETSPR